MKTLNILLGRFSPIHKGHRKSIDLLISRFGMENSAIFLGSSNVINQKTPFSAAKRTGWIRLIYPEIKIIPIPDFGNDTLWLANLKKLERKMNRRFVFYGGSGQDLAVLAREFETHILLNRSKSGAAVSATAVREALKKKDFPSARKLLDEKVFEEILRSEL